MEKQFTANEKPYLEIRKITKIFGDEVVALKDISFSVKEGELITLLGPSGCGKTTLLRIIAGLEQQNQGEIILAGRDISRLPPKDRDYGIVFQSYALFPNLTASENIAYGLVNLKKPRKEIEERVKELLQLIGLPDVGHKYPSQLSGGQQQRIALARALATSPSLLLLDEPLSALDARVRIALRLEIKHLQDRLGVTTIFVTHDQEEALVMSDRIVVMNKGTIEQIGTPEEIYRFPATPFVADFIGMMNFLSGVAERGNTIVRCGSVHFKYHGSTPFETETPVLIAIRPEDVNLRAERIEGENIFSVIVQELEFLGSFYRLTLSLLGLDGGKIVAEVSINRMRALGIRQGSSLYLHVPPELIRVYPTRNRVS